MRVSMQEFIDRSDDLANRAEIEPVTIVQGDRDRLILISVEEYARLKEQRNGSVGMNPSVPPTHDVLPKSGLVGLRGSMRHLTTYVAEDIAEPIGEA